MKPISDDDLVLLYYGEHEDPGLAARVASDEELSRRFDAIGAELGQLDRYAPPPRDEDYGADIWQAISARLGESDARPTGLLESLRNVLARPRFNLAGVAAVVGLLTVYSMTKIWNEAFWKPQPETGGTSDGASVPLSGWMVAPAAIMAACPPSTMAATPRLAKMRERPGPGETVTTAISPGSTGASLNW